MARFMTALVDDESRREVVIALTGDKAATLDDDYLWHEFVWQFAPDAKTAIDQHDGKFVAWRDDIDNGREPKETY